MAWLKALRSRLRALGANRGDAVHDEIDEEFRFHIDMRTEENLRRGMSPDEARRDAERRFGHLLLTKEQGYDVRGGGMLEAILQDARFAWRGLRKSPAFTLVAVLSLALGIGVNATVATFVSAILLRPLAVPEPENVVRVRDDNIPTYGDYLAFRNQSGAFSGLAAYAFDSLNMTADGTAGRVGVVKVTGNYFDVLKVSPVLGRSFAPDEDAPGAGSVAVISHGLWQRRFGGDPGIVGKTIALQNEPFTIVGVAPREFTGAAMGSPHDLWVPLAVTGRFDPNNDPLKEPERFQVGVIGRLKEGVSVEEAQAAIETIAAVRDQNRTVEISEEYGEERTTPRMVLPAAKFDLGPRDLQNAWLGVAGALAVGGLVLLVACANVANLLLGRAAARRKEIAVRLAIGAGRWRIVRQLLVESLLLSTIGGAAGLLLAQWLSATALSLMASFAPPEELDLVLDLGLDWRVLSFTLLLSFVTGIAFGLVPALQTSRADVTSALKDENTLLMRNRRRFSLRNALVVTQVAVSFLLLVPSGLLLRTFLLARSSEYGFPTEGRYVAAYDLGGLGYDEDRKRLVRRELLDRVRAMPGVRSATLSQTFPLSGGLTVVGLEIVGDRVASAPEDVAADAQQSLWALDQRQSLFLEYADTGYFETFGIPLLRGRDFTEQDDKGNPNVVVVNETLARRLAPDGNPIGKQLIERDREGKAIYCDVVGVARDIKYQWPSEKPRYFAYRPIRQSDPFMTYLTVRSDGGQAAVAGLVRSTAQALDPNVPAPDVRVLDEAISARVGSSKVLIWVMGSIGFLATLLACVGMYGVMAYAVSGRTKEIGVRMALGARSENVLRMILSEGLGLALVGIACGVLVAAAVTRVMSSVLYGVSPTDPLTFAGVAGILVATSLLACQVPALRATKVDPMIALRCE